MASFYATYPDSDKDVYGLLFKQIAAAEVTPDVGRDIVKQTIDKKKALKISETAFQVAQGFKTFEDLQTLLEDKSEPTFTDLPISEVSDNFETLLEGAYQGNGLRWRLNCLNKSLGSLRKGDFGFIFARPETGKTTFLASEITNMLKQSEHPVVWLNNEEDGWKVMLRVLTAYFAVPSDAILGNVKHYLNTFREETQGRFRLFDSAVISKQDVQKIVDQLNPQLVVYDQIDKIKGFSNDREDLRLGSIYQWARELAKGRHAAIGVCQADGTAEGVRYLTMEHVANAKTAKQAEADFILGIGKSGDAELGKARFMNISKNKLLGDKDSIADLRHGRFEVLLEPTIARYVDVIKLD